ncbi:MAG: RNA-protein complex protein Nop10 [Thermoprotei archaeon]|nr:MAG: RNA-protein complex protein Nop10 [Thermoprotei archaeon]
MQWNIRRCPKCKSYTLRAICPKCNIQTEIAHPHRFSPEDRYVRYRILAKITSGLIKLPNDIARKLFETTKELV